MLVAPSLNSDGLGAHIRNRDPKQSFIAPPIVHPTRVRTLGGQGREGTIVKVAWPSAFLQITVGV